MIEEVTLPNSGVGSSSESNRFEHFRAIIPITGSLFLGSGLACLLLTATPAFIDPWGMWFVAIAIWFVIAVTYVAAILLLLICLYPRLKWQAPVLLIARVCVLVPTTILGLVIIGKMICVVMSPSAWVQHLIFWTVVASIVFVTLSAPLVLIQNQVSVRPVHSSRRQTNALLKRLSYISLIILVAYGSSVWAANWKYDQDCYRVAAWIRDQHLSPGAYFDVALPGTQESLTDDHRVDAVIHKDGQIILVLKTSLSWHHNWCGIIYSTIPISTSDIGTDAYGRRFINVVGLPEHFIRKQTDAQHFVVAFDLG